jgi:HD-GYP domain-containing protein (c-di-GMP phosphodiesterase class II)
MNVQVLEKKLSSERQPRLWPTIAEGDTGATVQLLAENLASEFSAPIGIFDPDHRSWRTIVGATEAWFPKANGQLSEVAGSTGLRLGKVAIWRRKENPEIIWLVMPLVVAESADLVAFAGFRATAETSCGTIVASEAQATGACDIVKWGPACPDAALRAWGQQAVNRLQNDHETRVFPVQPAPGKEEDGEHIVIGRLIRRMRISDPPARFQALATNVLKASLGMAAVAWVPSEPHDAIVVSGEIEGLLSSSYRSLVPSNTRDSACLINNEQGPHSKLSTRFVHRYASVPAGSTGWLIAANPLHDRPIGTPEIERMQYVASLIATQVSNARTYAELKELLFGIIRALTAAIDAKDPYTSGHSERVARIAVRLAEELGIPSQKRSDLYLTGLLHDIGKIGVDDGVLKKTGPLTPEEFRKIQTHVEIGVTILKDLRKLSHILPGVRHHHESLDGSGYPDHLSGEDIPLEARILAVADSFDAMSSNRPYRKRLSQMQIDDILRKGRGSQWDPIVIDALFSCRMDIEAIRQKGLGESLIGAVNVALGRT